MDFLQFNFMAALQLELYKSQQEELNVNNSNKIPSIQTYLEAAGT